MVSSAELLSADAVQQIIHQGLPAAAESGLVVEQVTPGGARLRQRFEARQTRPGGTLSGPTMMALADAAMYAAILGNLGRIEMAVTQSLNINFLARPQPRDLIAECDILRMGRRSVVLQVMIYSDGDSQPVAQATGNYALPMSS